MNILVIEDNPVSRNSVRAALEAEGHHIIEAADGKTGLELMAREKPDLVLEDLLLPDVDGFDLASQLRASPGAADVPILALTGLLTKGDELRMADAPFADYLFKPVETERLVAAVRAHLAAARPRVETPGKKRRVLAIDDDPAQLKLLKTNLVHLGFEVDTAANGAEGWSKIKSWRPDAVVSDVLMPAMDGFEFCMKVRAEPELARVPVVLVSSNYEDEADKKLARHVGANCLVERTPDFAETIQALLKSLQQPPPLPVRDEQSLQAEHKERLSQQLDRQARLSAQLARWCAVQSAQISVLASVGENLQKGNTDTKSLLTDVLAHYLNVTGFSRGAIYLAKQKGQLELSAQLGFSQSAEDSLIDFFGNEELLRDAMQKGEPVSLSLAPPSRIPVALLLTQLRAKAALVNPLLFRAERLGVVVLLSETKEIDEEWLPFSKSISHQIGQAVAFGRAVSRLKYLADHDPLTGLANRNRLRERLQQIIVAGSPSALYLVNLDRFQEINNTLSYQNGDLLLRQAAQRLEGAFPRAETIARLGADEFAVLSSERITLESIRQTAQKIIKTLDPPFKLDRLPVALQASLGVALFPEHGDDPDDLLSYADIALRSAKKDRTGYAVYSSEIDQYSPQRLTMMGELRDAIGRDELELYYQPKISFKTGRTIGVEALVRWRHPQHGWIRPNQFVPLAEKTGLIYPLTRWVLGKALAQLKSWHDAGLEIGMAVNLSARDLQRSSLPEHVAQLRQAAGMTHNGLTLELTESALLADSDKTQAGFRRLRDMGVHFSIDDFGTGYSSLSYLNKLPVNEIKIDQSFVAGLTTDPDSAAIVRSTIDLGRDLGLTVVAEGVEDQNTWENLAALGCDAAQGYHMCRPAPAEELTLWMNESPWGVV
ncbi:MAG TPA: EAL domain-containing protein [Candidatus Binatia bacterium]